GCGGLSVAGSVEGATQEGCGAWLACLPCVLPAPPGVARRLAGELCQVPGRATIRAYLYRGDGRNAGPCQPTQHVPPHGKHGIRGGDREEGPPAYGGEGDGRRVATLGVGQDIALHLIEALERLRDGLDTRQPLDSGHAVPARYHQPQRKAVRGGKWLAIH